MTVCGIIAEYNPFHNGHLHQLQESIRLSHADYTIVVMSGNFMQRGTPALMDKYYRAKAALSCGADLVLELPAYYAAGSAEYFALGGVSLLDKLGIVTHLCFGSECGDIESLSAVGNRLNSDEFSDAFNDARAKNANRNLSFAALRSKVYENLYGEVLPMRPNDMLGIEYITALKSIKSDIQPITYKREAPFSATESRRLINEENSFDCLPEDILLSMSCHFIY
jgi:predicted nucleotidyltransferase